MPRNANVSDLTGAAALCALFLLLVLPAFATPDGKRHFDLPAGEAAETLRRFSTQAEVEIMFPVGPVSPVRTNAVSGTYTTREALDRLLSNTGLTAIQDEKTGALMIKLDGTAEAHSEPVSSQDIHEPGNIEAPDPKKPMKKRKLGSVLFAWLSLAIVPGPSASAQDANSAAPGSIIGRVSDANTGGFLRGVAVQITETGRSAVTDRTGRFEFLNVPEGDYSLRAEYIGYDVVIESVKVPAGGTVMPAILLGTEIVKLGEFVVEGYREMLSKSLQQKRMSTNQLDIISADSVGNLPDRNVAEAVSRIAGLNISQSRGEGQFVSIRGIEPNLNNVTFNGATVAPPGVGGRTGRATQLDIIAASQISQIEVTKSVTPDMDANSLGGTINIKTVSGFDKKDRFIYGSAETGDNSMSHKGVWAGDFTYGETFGKNKEFGVALAASYSNRDFVNDGVRASFIRDVLTKNIFPDSLRLVPEEGKRERLGLNLNLEYRPNSDTELFIRGIYNDFDETIRTDDIDVQVRRDSPTFVTPTSITFDRIRYEPKVFFTNPSQTLTNINVGGSTKFFERRLTVTAQATYSRGKETEGNFQGAQFRTGNVNAPTGQLFSIDFTEFLPTYNDLDILNAPTTALPFRRFREDTSLSKEETWTPQLDLKWDFTLPGDRSAFFKAGGKYTERDRLVDNNSMRPSTSAFTIEQMGARLPGRTFFKNNLFSIPLAVDRQPSFDFLNANRAAFPDNAFNSAQNSVEDDFDISEEIEALYGMLSVDVTPKLNFLVGMRYEHTNATVTGFQVSSNTTNTDIPDALIGGITTNTGGFKYDDYLPNAQFRWEITERLVFRGAFTQTLGRPAYEDASPIASLIALPILPATAIKNPAFPNTGTLQIGNPDLSPFRSDNYDIALEYYFKRGGAITISAFHKDIDNPIFEFEQTLTNTIRNGIAFESLSVTTTNNATKGNIDGIEVNLQLPFTNFLSGFAEGFDVNVNATFIDSNVLVFGRETENIGFFRQPDRIYNVSLGYEKYGFKIRGSYNYQDDAIRTLGADTDPLTGNDADFDVYNGNRFFFDLQASYRVNKNYTVFFSWRNITNERDDRFLGKTTRFLNRSEVFGSDIRGGIRFNF